MNHRLIILALAASAAFAAGYKFADALGDARYNALKLEYAERELATAQEIIGRNRKLNDKLTKVEQDAIAKQESLNRTVTSLRGRINGLLQAANDIADDSCAADNSQAADKARLLRADLLNFFGQRVVDLAEVADRSRIAGEACEAAYRAVEEINKPSV